MSQPEVTMIVVSWNVRDTLRRCLQSAVQSQGIQSTVVVVDNASSDGSAQMVRDEFPNIRLLANETNRGFAAAVNQGIVGAPGDVLLLNPDVVLESDTVLLLERWLQLQPRVGIVGPRLVYPDGRHQPSVKRFPRWRDLFLTLTKLPNVWPSFVRRYQATDFDYHRSQVSDQVMGSCFLIRQQALVKVGTFDEDFWIWFEEVDYCHRAKDQGWLTWYAADAKATHVRAASFRQLTTRRKQQVLRQSMVHYVRKYFGLIGVIGLWPALAISWLAGLVIDGLKLSKPRIAAEQ